MPCLPDPRIAPYRNDLAARSLRDTVDAPRYVDAREYEVMADAAPFHAGPDRQSEQVTQALFGERISVYEKAGGWCWGQIESDGYVGYVPAELLTSWKGEKTQKVSALRTYVFSKPNLKSPTSGLLSLGSKLRAESETSGFLGAAGGFVWGGHVSDVETFETDHVDVARRFLGAPYLWGGRTSIGLDCSALVQLSLAATGIDCPRDSDMQMSVGSTVPADRVDRLVLQRGDLVFWKGHVAIATTNSAILHANAHHMAVAEEPLSVALERIQASGLTVLGVRRL